MSENGGYRVDAGTERRLGEIKNDLHETLVNLMQKEFKELKQYVSELFGKDIQRIDKALDVSDKKHLEHYNDNDKRRDEIYTIKESIAKTVHDIVDDKFQLFDTRISSIKETQIQCQARSTNNDVNRDQIQREDERKDKRKNTIIAIILLSFTVLSGFVGSIFYLASKLTMIP